MYHLELRIFQLVKKFSACYLFQTLISLFTVTRHWFI